MFHLYGPAELIHILFKLAELVLYCLQPCIPSFVMLTCILKILYNVNSDLLVSGSSPSGQRHYLLYTAQRLIYKKASYLLAVEKKNSRTANTGKEVATSKISFPLQIFPK